MEDLKYITYFDYLGFADFIKNNDMNYHRKIMSNVFRDVEMALADGKSINAQHGFIPDLSKSKVNAINFSDTVVYWTNDTSEDSLKELLQVTYV